MLTFIFRFGPERHVAILYFATTENVKKTQQFSFKEKRRGINTRKTNIIVIDNHSEL